MCCCCRQRPRSPTGRTRFAQNIARYFSAAPGGNCFHRNGKLQPHRRRNACGNSSFRRGWGTHRKGHRQQPRAAAQPSGASRRLVRRHRRAGSAHGSRSRAWVAPNRCGNIPARKKAIGEKDTAMANAKSKGFPLPSSLQVIPGTELAQAAYPYYMQFSQEDDQRFWFYNSMHFPEPMCCFDTITAEAAYCALGAANTRVHSLPTTLGIDYRIINGRIYIGGNAVTDPAEISRRTEEFQRRAFYYYANWERLFAHWKDKMMALIREAEALPKLDLPEFEPLEHVHSGRGIASNHYLLVVYQKTLEGYFRMWHHHFEFLLLGYGAYLTFFMFCKKAFPEISDQTVARMVAGIEAEIFRPDEEVRRLARRAVELGVDEEFTDGRAAQAIIAALEARGAAGRSWLEELATSRDPWFNINVGDGFYHYHRSWNDDLSMPFAGLPGYIARVKAGESLERPIEALQAQRRQLIQDYRELLSSEEERQAYDQMIGLAHRVFPYVEGHKFYCEHWYTNLFFNKIREFGALLAAHGFFAREEDVFQLTHYELEAAIIDLMTSWSNGSPPRGPGH